MRSTAEVCAAVLTAHSTRLVMSVLILVSLTPVAWVEAWRLAFFAVFALELAMRTIVILARSATEVSARRRTHDLIFFAFDLIALVSFLPIEWLPGGRFLRLPRFLRLFMLLGYWGPALHSLFTLLARPERRLQLWLLTATVGVLSFVSATLLEAVGREELTRELGLGADAGFVHLWWWSFRQIQDPGNLVHDVRHLGIATLSIVLTGCGLMLISFLIGVGTSVVEELVEMTRDRALGLRGHSIIVNADSHTHFFLEAVSEYYRKQLQRPRWMVLGPNDDVLRRELESRYRGISYRRGDAFEPEALARVDADRAKRIVVVSNKTSPSPDAATVSVLLAARHHNTGARLFAEILDERHASAFFNAGGERTVVVPTEHMLALAIANVAVLPSSLPIFDELLSARGTELYSYYYVAGERRSRIPADVGAYRELVRAAWDCHSVVLIGLALEDLSASDTQDTMGQIVLLPERHPELMDGKREVLGVIAIAPSFQWLARTARAMAQESLTPTAAPSPPLPGVELGIASEEAESGRYLITGLLSRTSMIIEYLLALHPTARIWWMVENPARVLEARAQLLESARSARRFGEGTHPLGGQRGTFEELSPHSFAYRDAAGVLGPGRVHLVTGDWASRDSLLEPRPHGYSLRQIDRILLQAGGASRDDRDALDVMSVMKLENLAANPSFANELSSNLHVLLEMVDADKANLIRDRAAVGGSGALSIEVLASERIRNVLLFHSTVVPGFAAIFLRAFGTLRISRFELTVSPGSTISTGFGQLAELVAERTGGALLGVELHDGRQATASLVPPTVSEPIASEARVPLADIRAVLVLGATRAAPPIATSESHEATIM